MGIKKKRRPDTPVIFAFSTFSEFFAAYIKFRKDADPSFSFAVLSRTLKCGTPSLLAMIARGERTPQPKMLMALAAQLDFDDKEVEFAKTLIGFERAKTILEKAHYENRIRQLRPSNEDITVELDSLEFFTKWYNVAICEMASLKDFRADPEWISTRLNRLVTKDDAEASLALLQRLGLLVQDDAKGLKKSAAGFVANVSPAIKLVYHQQMLDLAKASLDKADQEPRKFIGTTLAIEPNRLVQVERRIDDFIDDLRKEFASQAGDAVYHLAVQFFDITKQKMPLVNPVDSQKNNA